MKRSDLLVPKKTNAAITANKTKPDIIKWNTFITQTCMLYVKLYIGFAIFYLPNLWLAIIIFASSFQTTFQLRRRGDCMADRSQKLLFCILHPWIIGLHSSSHGRAPTNITLTIDRSSLLIWHDVNLVEHLLWKPFSFIRNYCEGIFERKFEMWLNSGTPANQTINLQMYNVVDENTSLWLIFLQLTWYSIHVDSINAIYIFLFHFLPCFMLCIIWTWWNDLV